MLKIIQAPRGPVQIKEQFVVMGTASTDYAGQNLMLTIDNQYKSTGPVIDLDGSWQLYFLFQQAGNRQMRISIDNESVDLTIQVVATAPPPPSTSKVYFTTVPRQAQTGNTVIFAGGADGYADGTTLLLTADQRYELARPLVQGGKWQAPVVFGQAGSRLIEITGSGQDRAQLTLQVVTAPPPPPRSPRLQFTSIPNPIREEELVTIGGSAVDYPDNAQLILRADGIYELARPRITSGQWQAQVLFRQPGQRLLEIIGSEQDKAQVTIAVQANANVQILARSTWTNNPTPTSLPTLTPKRITIHHTALTGSPAIGATVPQEAERMRFIWRSHVNGNGWSDIGYHFIIMPSGRIYEARAENRRGAHDVINDGLGVAFDGVFSSATISQQQFNSAVALCTLLCKRYGFLDPVTPVPTPTDFGGPRNLPLILGHRDRVATECPGSDGGKTVRLAEIRQTVKSKL